MTAQTHQTAVPVAQSRDSYHWILSLDVPGRVSASFHGTFVPRAGETRQSAYETVRADIDRAHPKLAKATVVFFALEPNQL